MGNAARALRRDVPDVDRVGHEVLGKDVVLEGEAARFTVGPRLGTVEAALARHDDSLGDVADHGIRRASKGTPRAITGRAFTLAPDDLAPEQESEIVLQDADHVGGKAAVRLAAEVGDVHRDAATRFELPLALREHRFEQLEVFGVRARDAVAFELLFVLLAGEVRR